MQFLTSKNQVFTDNNFSLRPYFVHYASIYTFDLLTFDRKRDCLFVHEQIEETINVGSSLRNTDLWLFQIKLNIQLVCIDLIKTHTQRERTNDMRYA